MNPLQTLTQINLDDLISSFGWQNQPLLVRALRTVFYKPALRFAEIMMEFDLAIKSHGLVQASQLTQNLFVRDIRVFGLDHLPDSAFLALSNHPGVTDTLSLFCALNRPDLKIIALERPFLKTLPNMSKHLFYLKEDVASRISLVRQVATCLRAGGAVLTFPAGQIEPDPAIYEGAANSLTIWTDSVGAFIRMAPETVVLPVLVRHVIWEKTAKHPLLKLRKTRDEKEKLAAALQLLAMVMWNNRPVTVTVQIGRPIDPKQPGITDTQIIHQALLNEKKNLINNPPTGQGISVL